MDRYQVDDIAQLTAVGGYLLQMGFASWSGDFDG
jgi:hypothetical protein